MKYPRDIIESFATVGDFAAAASRHPLAPRAISANGVYTWRTRDWVPYMWQPVVAAMRAETEANAT